MLSVLRKLRAVAIASVLILSSNFLPLLVSRPIYAAAQTRTISAATANSTVASGANAKWRQVAFVATAGQSGQATFRLSWTGTADLRFQIGQNPNGVIGGNITAGAGPKTYSLALTGGASYFANIWAFSGTGVYTLTVTENFPDASDTTAPSVPTNLASSNQTTNSISLNWTASTDAVGVTGYQVLRDGTQVGTPSSNSFTDTGLTANTSYNYTLKARDAANNVSSESYPLTVSTTIAPPPDTTPPSTPLGLASPTQTSTSVQLSWNASTDDDAIKNYVVYRDGSIAGTVTTTSFNNTGLTASHEYSYQVLATDNAGNTSELSEALAVSTTTAPAQRPNVIVINTDDQRWETVQWLPKINQWFTNQGTTFPNAYVTSPTCCPSRAGLMSGQYVHNNGQYQHLGVEADVTKMTQRYLHDSGYLTGHAGKFLHWWELSQVAPYWDRWTYFKGGYDNVWMRLDNKTVQSQGYSTTITFDRAVEYLNDFESRGDSTPFYMQLTPIAPHAPFTPEAKYANAAVPAWIKNPANNETDKTDKPMFVKNMNNTDASIENTRRQQIRTLYTLDDQVDKLMLALQAKGELDNTMMIFTSDNGYMWGEHNLDSKFLPYEPSVKVPMIIRWPGHVAEGAVDNRYVSQIDILPTILAATGVTQNLATLDGHDILSGYARSTALTEYYYDAGNGNNITTWASLRTPQYMYTEYYAKNNATNTAPSYREYYDMVNDPYQLKNLLGDTTTANDPSNLAQLSATLANAKTCVGTACP